MRLFILLFFFFSSRRRHTRLVSDWSSDVCSSDLTIGWLNMIPDNTFIFNQPIVPRNFDDFETRLRYRLGQDALPTLEGGRHLLYTCPICQYSWYKAGGREYPRLTSKQLACLSSALHVDCRGRTQRGKTPVWGICLGCRLPESPGRGGGLPGG